MRIRPLTPNEYLGRWEDYEQLNDCEDHYNEMQEALTAEWLIEWGFMFDPTQLDPNLNPETYDECWVLYEWDDVSETWGNVREDKTK